MGALGGPSPIAGNGQVTIPKDVMTAMGWPARTRVMFRQSEDDPEVLTLVPVEVFERRYERGESAERLMRMTSSKQTGADVAER